MTRIQQKFGLFLNYLYTLLLSNQIYFIKMHQNQLNQFTLRLNCFFYYNLSHITIYLVLRRTTIFQHNMFYDSL